MFQRKIQNIPLPMICPSTEATITRACDRKQLFAQPIRIVASQAKCRRKNARFVFAFFMHDIERIIAQLAAF
jgi:hypothetical protein